MAVCGTGITYIDFDSDFTDETPATPTFYDESRFKETLQQCQPINDDLDEQQLDEE